MAAMSSDGNDGELLSSLGYRIAGGYVLTGVCLERGLFFLYGLNGFCSEGYSGMHRWGPYPLGHCWGPFLVVRR